MNLIGHIPTLIGAAVLIAIAFGMRRLPRFGPRRWIMPAWVLIPCLLAVFELKSVYADELYSVYQYFTAREYYGSAYTSASPHAMQAITITLGLVALCAAVALELARARSGANCPRCLHHLLPSQRACPECGRARDHESGDDSSRLDALAVRRPLIAWILQFAALSIPAGTLVVAGIAFLPTLRERSYPAAQNPLFTIDGGRRRGHARVTADYGLSIAPKLPGAGWTFNPSIYVRYSMEWDGTPRRPRPDWDTAIHGHYEDIVIEARVTSTDDYEKLLKTLQEAPVSTIDRSRSQQYIESLLETFLQIPTADIPQTPTNIVWSTAPESPSPYRNGLARQSDSQPGSVAFPAQVVAHHDEYWPGEFDPLDPVRDRDSPMQTLVIPSAIGLTASLVLFWPQRRKTAKVTQE